MSCDVQFEECKRAGERLPVGFNLTRFCTNYWRANAVRAEGDVVRPSEKKTTGLQYVAQGDGQSGPREPSWPTEVDEEVTDGSITWKAEALGNTSLHKRVQSATWSSEPAGLTFSGPQVQNTIGRQAVATFVEPGIVRGTFLVSARVTFDNTEIADFIGEVLVTA